MALNTMNMTTLLAAGGILLGLVITLMIGLYVYSSFAWMSIARKLGFKDAWLAWVPVANLALIPILAGKKWTWVFMFLVPIANIVYYFIWTWKIYEKRKYPGWLSLISLIGIIPFLSMISGAATFVVLGLVAWNDR